MLTVRESYNFFSVTMVQSLVTATMLVCVSNAGAFECEQHIAAAQEAIDKVTGDMTGMQMMDMAQMKAVNGLLDRARSTLEEAKKTHDSAKTPAQHAQAIGTAEAAVGYATAADIYHWKIMRQ